MKLRRVVVELLVPLPGIAALLVAVFLGQTDMPIARWCVQYWWTVLVGCGIAISALRLYFHFKERGHVPS